MFESAHNLIEIHDSYMMIHNRGIIFLVFIIIVIQLEMAQLLQLLKQLSNEFVS